MGAFPINRTGLNNKGRKASVPPTNIPWRGLSLVLLSLNDIVCARPTNCHGKRFSWFTPRDGGTTMSDPVTTPAADDPTPKADEVLGEGGLSALRAERAANKDLKAQLKALEDAQKARDDAELSALQKAEKKAEDALAKLKGYETAQKVSEIKARVAEALKVPADLLAGEDEASITAFGERLAAHLGPQKPNPNPFLGQPGAADNPGGSDAEALQALGFGGI